MRTALVMMTILGCDDSATDCRYVATLEQRWPTLELCNAVSEKELAAFANISYPVVIAVCQDPSIVKAEKAVPAQKPAAPPPAEPATPQEQRAQEENLARQALGRVRNILPSGESVRNLVQSPVRLMEDGYSWVARKLR
ncbi:hypothetical protein J2858_002442 [Neorhizobium galegae]|uniref:hypothetical protein n=1 Tax=Neorhizobium galegae TaxID=399 RepID=UPI001AE39E67|nr:hypothetical protein [Neorhizobium galegae]MBP2549519.1 hypothetical protein [Neorhizobium galegae]